MKKRMEANVSYRDPAPFHRLTPNKRFEPVFSTVIMVVCSLFNRMLLLTDLIPLHLLYCGQTVMIGCNHTSFEWTTAFRHIYGIIRYMQGLYTLFLPELIFAVEYFLTPMLTYYLGVVKIQKIGKKNILLQPCLRIFKFCSFSTIMYIIMYIVGWKPN